MGIAVLAAASLGGWAAVRGTSSSTPSATTTTPAAGTATAAGKAVFVSTGCGGCHTLADAGGAGTVGPNFDQVKPSAAIVTAFVTDGKGAMPAYKTSLTAKQIADLAEYVSQAAG